MPRGFGEPSKGFRIFFWITLIGAAYHVGTLTAWFLCIFNDRYRRKILREAQA